MKKEKRLLLGGPEMPEVAGFIQRKSMLYETGVEYGDYTINHILGCAHGCLYPCYAFQQKKRYGQVSTYEDWLKPYLVANTLELLDYEIPKLRNKITSVQLCFTTDPFMYGYQQVVEMSLAAIEKLNAENIKCIVLTKGILPLVLADRDRFSMENEYGITLITMNEKYRQRKEPFAAPLQKRLEALKMLHEVGRKTWVSIEPYPTPNQIDQSLKELLEAVSFVDRIIFGRTNYCREVTEGYPMHKHFYNEKAKEVIDFCKKRRISYHIKKKTMSKE